MNTLVFLYKKVLKSPLDEKINAVRPAKKNIPVVMTREETAKAINMMGGTTRLKDAVSFLEKRKPNFKGK